MSPTHPHAHTFTLPPPVGSRWWDLPAAFLLLTALVTAASCLIATGWIDHLSIVRILTFWGALAGLALGQSRFSPRQASAFALSYALFAVPWRLGLTLECGIDVLWTERLIILAGRLISALGQLARQEAVQDPFLFLFCMDSLFWVLSVHAGYTLTRHAHPWRTILPVGLTLLIIQNSDPYVAPRIWPLAVYLFFSLLLLARLTYLRHRIHWQQTHAHVPPFTALDFTQAILLASVLLILVAWLAPVLADALPAVREAWQETTHPWFTAVRDLLDRAFASLRRTVVLTVTDHYGESLSLGRGSELTDALILTVQGPSSGGMSRYYWRARVYDNYADGRWSSVAFSTTQSINPTGLGLTFPENVGVLEGRRTFTFTFTSAIPIATLYAASQPRWVSLPIQAGLAHNPDGAADLAVLHVTSPLHAGDTYQARSSLCVVTIAQLRAAGTDYPLWVTSRYLQLPPTITPRTRELARQIAANLDDSYDIAAAVTGYLRATIRYTETVPSRPLEGEDGGQEPLDWFLFDLRQGFCNYYASAEVILLRSLNIPARLAVGFAEGERQDWSNSYLVRQHDAHAWPEVYFPGLGWVEFEPTASQSPLYRPLGESWLDAASAGLTTPPGGDTASDLDDRLDKLLAADEDMISEPSSSALDSGKSVVFWVVLLALSLILVALAYRTRRQDGLPLLPVLLEAGLRRFDLQPPAALRRWCAKRSLAFLEG